MNTPVVFIIFNRPDTAERVFEVIRQVQPTKLLVVADGPRSNRPGAEQKCMATRSIIQKVDWNCEVHTNFSDVNLGCRDRISSGLNWVFEMVEEAITLKDDCLPHISFFRFCQALLNYYRNDTRVMHICGNYFGSSNQYLGESYFFSLFCPILGWVAWRRAWKYFDVAIPIWSELKFLLDHPRFFLRDSYVDDSYFKSLYARDYYSRINRKLHRIYNRLL